VAHRITGSYIWRTSSLKYIPNQVCNISHKEGGSIAYFDGVTLSTGKCCGPGDIIRTLDSIVIKLHINCGAGTNTKEELMGTWDTLTIASLWSIQKIQVLGDS
jgi:hypothetical protein